MQLDKNIPKKLLVLLKTISEEYKNECDSILQEINRAIVEFKQRKQNSKEGQN